MKRPLPLFALGLLALPLASCGALLSVVPPIPVGDPMGLSGTELTPTGEAAFQPAAVAATVARTGTFDNLAEDPRSRTLGQTPRSVSTSVSVDGARLNPGCASGLALTGFDLTVKSLEATLSDADTALGTIRANLPAPVALTFTRNADGTFKAAENHQDLVFGNVGAILDILTKGGRNTVGVKATLGSSRDELLGCTVTLVLGRSDTSVRF